MRCSLKGSLKRLMTTNKVEIAQWKFDFKNDEIESLWMIFVPDDESLKVVVLPSKLILLLKNNKSTEKRNPFDTFLTF